MSAKKKTIKVMAIVISVVVAVITVLVGKYLVFKHVMTNAAVAHLCEKYQISESELELLDYEREHNAIYWRDTGTPISEPTKVHCNYRWQFKYNDREFFVIRIGGRFYDDYQLEDITQWAIEWFKDNISDDIITPGYSTQTIINFQKSFGLSGNEYIFTKENIFDFISSTTIYESKDDCILLYCYSPDMSLSSSYEERESELKNKIDKILPGTDYLLINTQYKTNCKLIINKDLTWYRFYECAE